MLVALLPTLKIFLCVEINLKVIETAAQNPLCLSLFFKEQNNK